VIKLKLTSKRRDYQRTQWKTLDGKYVVQRLHPSGAWVVYHVDDGPNERMTFHQLEHQLPDRHGWIADFRFMRHAANSLARFLKNERRRTTTL